MEGGAEAFRYHRHISRRCQRAAHSSHHLSNHTQGHSHPSSCTPNVRPPPKSSTLKVIHIQGHSHPRSRHTCANYVRDHLHPMSSTQKFHIHPRSFTYKVVRTHVSTPHPRSSHIQKKLHGTFPYERKQQNVLAKAFQSI